MLQPSSDPDLAGVHQDFQAYKTAYVRGKVASIANLPAPGPSPGN